MWLTMSIYSRLCAHLKRSISARSIAKSPVPVTLSKMPCHQSISLTERENNNKSSSDTLTDCDASIKSTISVQRKTSSEKVSTTNSSWKEDIKSDTASVNDDEAEKIIKEHNRRFLQLEVCYEPPQKI
ncbi:hypothetical protein Tcan_10023 [Toxocara canis]|uniref:Uncharacterized protein n=1 Tax=Toxocara canis TaxID=6265 RepID=A0A0B2W1E6_TOXCA|nr:hypothetical protein Tcan_10023 [Toxocara canis]